MNITLLFDELKNVRLFALSRSTSVSCKCCTPLSQLKAAAAVVKCFGRLFVVDVVVDFVDTVVKKPSFINLQSRVGFDRSVGAHQDGVLFLRYSTTYAVHFLQSHSAALYAVGLRFHIYRKIILVSRGGGQMVSLLAFNSDNPSSNPAEAYIFSVEFVFEKNEKTQRGQGWPIKKFLSLRKHICLLHTVASNAASLNGQLGLLKLIAP